VICPPDAFEPSFGPGSLERHLQAAREADLSHRVEEVESLMHDVDTADDLAALGEELERRRGVAPRTRGALRQFDRLHVRPADRAGVEHASDDDRQPEERQEAATVTGWRPTREAASTDQRPVWA
jgi:2-phospho-L-lactate guanylyltransferase (CobY/MobA/RfbA family)